MQKEYPKKSYGFLVIWLLSFVLTLSGGSILLEEISDTTKVKFLLIWIVYWLMLLFYIIYKTERVYWITGVAYEEAKQASSEQRKRYALAYFHRVLIAFIITVLYCLVGSWLQFTTVGDIVAVTILLLGVTISTVTIKLE